MKTTVPAWNYCSLGGAIRVKIDNGRDLQRLGELDEKYWTVLSCPVADLEFDQETLRLIDSDNDGKVRVGEMVGAARWLCSVIKDKDSIFKGESELGLDNIDRSCGQGQRLYDSARQILHNLGKDSDRISVADASVPSALSANVYTCKFSFCHICSSCSVSMPPSPLVPNSKGTASV